MALRKPPIGVVCWLVNNKTPTIVQHSTVMPLKFEPTSHINVSLACEGDIPKLREIFWDVFGGPGEALFPHTDGGKVWLERSFQNFIGSKSSFRPQGRLAVIRNNNGHPVSLILIHVVKAGQSVVGKSWRTRWHRTEEAKDVNESKLAAFFEPMARAHHLAMGKRGHIFIELLMTKPTHRLRGNGTALMEWATELADELDYPCYLDGGGQGMSICERLGFEAQDLERRYGGQPPCVPMVRKSRTEAKNTQYGRE